MIPVPIMRSLQADHFSYLLIKAFIECNKEKMGDICQGKSTVLLVQAESPEGHCLRIFSPYIQHRVD